MWHHLGEKRRGYFVLLSFSLFLLLFFERTAVEGFDLKKEREERRGKGKSGAGGGKVAPIFSYV